MVEGNRTDTKTGINVKLTIYKLLIKSKEWVITPFTCFAKDNMELNLSDRQSDRQTNSRQPDS